MAGEYQRFLQNARDSLRQLDSPWAKAEALEQDIRPSNIEALQQAIKDRRHQSPMQQRVLGEELKRIQLLQTQQLQQAAQRMPQELEKSLSPAKTGEPWPSPEASMVRLMLQMQRRHGGFRAESANYDMDSAVKAGLQADSTGHWPSRIPTGSQEGLLLKGRGHQTWPLTEQGEREAGMEIYQGPNRRYYSRPR